MPWWVILLIRYGVPLLLSKGVINEVEADAINIWYAAKTLKTYPEYPTGKNGAKTIKPVANGQQNGNFNH